MKMTPLRMEMTGKQIFFGFILLLTLALPYHALTCTTFYLYSGDAAVVGTNFDWYNGSGLIIVNQRGVSKTGMPVSEKDPVLPPAWISKYGSLTFNQYGRETPMGGINEAGLVVHQMMLRKGIYPAPDSRRPVKNLQWVQYHLDNFSTVAQVIDSQSDIRIQQLEEPGLHYLVADRQGNCASLEWIHGVLFCHTGDTMPFKVLANNTYSESLRYLKQHRGFGGTQPFNKTSTRSLDRFARSARMVKRYPGTANATAVSYAFDILENVKGYNTRWRIVYDVNNLNIHFQTELNRHIRSIDLNRFDLSCNGPVNILDLDAPLSGDISSRFIEYTTDINEKFIKKAFASTSFLFSFSDEYIHQRSLYPETTTCSE